MKLRSPAKVNLYLRIVRKRPDGFHEIETVFERIALFDDVTIRPARSGTRVSCSDPEVPSGPGNLAWKAAELLRSRFGVKAGVRIHIRKRIPSAAGLGGGSSDAASVLVGLNRLWRLRLSRKRLAALAAGLGSDVPFFVWDAPLAVGRGRGERLRILPAPGRRLWHCLVKPPFGISTKEAYGAWRASLTPPGGDVKMLLHSIHKGSPQALAPLLFNSLEASLNKRVRSITKIKTELLRAGALGCLLSGSGSTVFGVCSSKAVAFKAARFLKARHKDWKVFAVATY
ncbi:MAG TPA: 4-(cytidine 5'-diphospho)-2-C-methyl-D-erythritol kinase [Candidatus Eisenbacteria bacterium]|nr:4-(cytidine 5'-diphospho)-2-C-methyl-D-erythritol kinase [Candidatus Eisenbacteria bacterium]